MRIRARTSWRAYVRTTSGLVDNPIIYLLTSYTSLAFSILFAWHTLARTGPFWANINNILFFGWVGLLLSILTLTQIKWINRAIGLPVIGIFLLALSTYIYGDAKATTVQRLNHHFSFSISQLTEAIDVGGRIGFATEIAGIPPAYSQSLGHMELDTRLLQHPRLDLVAQPRSALQAPVRESSRFTWIGCDPG